MPPGVLGPGKREGSSKHRVDRPPALNRVNVKHEVTSMDRLNVDVNAYVPRWVRAAMAKDRFSRNEPTVESTVAAVVLLDIAGFVETTNQLARRGPAGAEELSGLLNDCFAPLTDIIRDYGETSSHLWATASWRCGTTHRGSTKPRSWRRSADWRSGAK